MQQEKRTFQRVPINLGGLLSIPNYPDPITVTVLDVSLQGMRVILPAPIENYSQQVLLSFKGDQDSPLISMVGSIAHQHPLTEGSTEAGIQITHIGVDELTWLRRLLLLNSGQQDLDEAELSALVDKITNALSGE